MPEPLTQKMWAGKSWVESANDLALGFPLQSLPYCSFISPAAHDEAAHLGVGIGTFVLDLHELSRSGLLAPLGADLQTACTAAQLNPLMSSGSSGWAALRQILSDLLREDAPPEHRRTLASFLVSTQDLRFRNPIAVENYTDFYASIHHATNVGKLFRPDQPLLPNYEWVPIGYHGRASSLVLSGTNIRRPSGQSRRPGQKNPIFAPSTQLDYELEVAAYVGVGNPLGSSIPIAEAERHIFGISLLNDWSARDIQAWEAQPLGPFLGKNFATSISPWVVSMAALSPFRVPTTDRAPNHPKPLPYLIDPQTSGINLKLEALLLTARMREASIAPIRLSKANLRDLYWSFAQIIAHHTSNGCNLLTGDILASGTISGVDPDSLGCLLEITQRGASPLRLPNGETRAFLEDGDEIILRGYCEKEGHPRISLGECRGTILPAAALS